MILLWALIAIGEIAIIAAGVQAIHMMSGRDSRVAWLETQIATANAEVASTQKQLDAQKILLKQASDWLEAERQRANQIEAERARAKPPSPPPAPTVSQPPAPAAAPVGSDAH